MSDILKSYVNNFTLRIGSISTIGRLVAVEQSVPVKAKTKFVTPDGKSVKKVYVAEDDLLNATPTVFQEGQLEKAVLNDEGENVLVGKENLAAVKTSQLPKNVLNLTVHDANDVDSQLVSGKNAVYVFLPDEKDPANVQWGELLIEIVRQSGQAFIGMCNLNNHEGLFRVGLWRGQLTIQKQLYPEQVKPIPAKEGTSVKTSTVEKAVGVITQHVAPFDVDTYRDLQSAAVKELTDAAIGGNIDVVVENIPVAVATEVDIEAALDAFTI